MNGELHVLFKMGQTKTTIRQILFKIFSQTFCKIVDAKISHPGLYEMH